jgi:hypothetical protein
MAQVPPQTTGQPSDGFEFHMNAGGGDFVDASGLTWVTG